ncbi:MAG: KTSC domain-containing protein, partial [Acidobacteriaceae bacterium]|nr:KTSC domain-containing protein [Acidobacteriaceae bacterium]MBV9984679.1 KTSC domain-containing protein [Bradyrhizobium sp.]
MRRRRVDSSTMRSVGYEGKSGVLEIEFESGAV